MLDNEARKDIQTLIDSSKGVNDKISISTILISIKCSEEDIPEVITLFENEGISVIHDDIEDETDGYNTDDIKITPFNPSKIDIKMDKITVDSVIKRIKNNELEFDSSFQRKAGLWGQAQKSQLIESILLKIPLPAFYFDASDDDKWQIIDGLQRISTIKEYVVKQSFGLTGLEFLKDLTGMKYGNLPRALQRRLEETNLNAYLLGANTPKNVKFNIFKRINTGGLVLEPQEIRNALYQGQASDFLLKMANTTEFKKATDYSIKTDRMLDREFCLRYVAFTEFDFESEYDGYLDNYLNKAMQYLRDSDDGKLDAIIIKLRFVMATCYDLFGKFAFRRIGPNMRRGPVNKALFETWSNTIFNMNKDNVPLLCKKKKELQEAFFALTNDYNFQNAIKAADRNSIKARQKEVNSIVNKVLNG